MISSSKYFESTIDNLLFPVAVAHRTITTPFGFFLRNASISFFTSETIFSISMLFVFVWVEKRHRGTAFGLAHQLAYLPCIAFSDQYGRPLFRDFLLCACKHVFEREREILDIRIRGSGRFLLDIGHDDLRCEDGR